MSDATTFVCSTKASNQNCEENDIENTKCEKCMKGYYPDQAGDCQTCPNSCTECDRDGKCEKCPAQKRPNPDSQQAQNTPCVACSDIANCEDCDSDGCRKCAANYINYEGVCYDTREGQNNHQTYKDKICAEKKDGSGSVMTTFTLVVFGLFFRFSSSFNE